jgi:hypothetical protein
MTSAEYRSLNQKPGKAPAKPSDGTTTPPKPKDEPTPQELAARREVIRPASLSYTNTTFGVTVYCLKFQVTDPDHAAALLQRFEELTNP